MQLQIEKPSVNNPGDEKVNILSGNEKVMLLCRITGDDIIGAYWEKDGKSLPSTSNMSALNDNKNKLQLIINEARPTHSGIYHCVAYSQWGVAKSRNVRVNITSKSNNVLM